MSHPAPTEAEIEAGSEAGGRPDVEPTTRDSTNTEADPPTAAEQEEAKRYSAATLRVTLADMAVDLVVLTVLALVAGSLLDRWLRGFAWLAGERSLPRVAALGVLLTGIHALASAPLACFGGFVLEHRFGLSRQSFGAWAKSWFKRNLLTMLLLGVMYTGLLAIVWSAESWWWIVAAGMFFLVSAVFGQLAPVLIIPLFYKVEKLKDDDSTQRLSGMAEDAGLTLEGVYRLGMSEETSKANAMLAGLGSTRRVLLGDTLIDSFSPAETDIVFAHELGHHVHRHLPKLLALSALWASGGFYAVHWALAAWTGQTDPALWSSAALPKMILLLTLFSMLIGPLQNLVSRHFERQADRYAIQATNNPAAFRSAFLKLARMNKAELDPPPLEVFLLHSHQPIAERLRAAGNA